MKSGRYNKYNANYMFSPIPQVYFMLCSVLTTRKLFTKSFMIIRNIAITFVFLCRKQGFFPSKVKALCKQKCKLSRGIPGRGLLSAELYTFEISIAATAFPHTIVTRSMKISTRAQFYTLDPFDYKKKSKDNRNVPEFRGHK